ncbi:MAG: hypothetical protein ACK4K0_02820 [Flavobacteriales bacterium]
MRKLILLVYGILFLVAGKSQTLPAQNFYNFYENYALIDTIPDSLKTGYHKEFDRNFRIWGPRLYPSGNFSVAANAIYNYTQEFLNTTKQSCGGKYSGVS